MRKLGLSLTGPSPFVINMANQSPLVPVGIIKDCRLSTGGEEYIVTFQVIKMHDNKNAFPILLGRPWLRMSNAVVDRRGQKPFITYGPINNRVKVSMAPLSGWVREDIDPMSDEEENGGSNERIEDTLVGVIQDKEKTKMYSSSGFLGSSFYNQDVDGDFTHWLRRYPESISDVMMMTHSCIFQDEVSREDYLSLESCEVLTEKKWVKGGFTPWLDDIELSDVSLVHVDGTQDEKAMLKLSKLKPVLHFKTTSTSIIGGYDVKDYPNVPNDWYRDTEEQTRVVEEDWKFVDVKMKDGKVRPMKMGSKFDEREIKEYSDLIYEFSDTFVWLYDELKGIPREMVEHRIPLVPGSKPVRQKERRMNPRLQLLVKAELDRLLQSMFGGRWLALGTERMPLLSGGKALLGCLLWLQKSGDQEWRWKAATMLELSPWPLDM